MEPEQSRSEVGLGKSDARQRPPLAPPLPWPGPSQHNDNLPVFKVKGVQCARLTAGFCHCPTFTFNTYGLPPPTYTHHFPADTRPPQRLDIPASVSSDGNSSQSSSIHALLGLLMPPTPLQPSKSSCIIDTDHQFPFPFPNKRHPDGTFERSGKMTRDEQLMYIVHPKNPLSLSSPHHSCLESLVLPAEMKNARFVT